jgi:hypothetical protein
VNSLPLFEFRTPSASIDLRHAAKESFSNRGCSSATARPQPGDPLSSGGPKPEEEGHQSNASRGRPPEELHQEGFFNDDDWYENFHHGNFAFDDVSPLSAEL